MGVSTANSPKCGERELSMPQTQKEGGKDERYRGGRPVRKGPGVQAQAENPSVLSGYVWGMGGGIHHCPSPLIALFLSLNRRCSCNPPKRGKTSLGFLKTVWEFSTALRNQDLGSNKSRASVCSGCKLRERGLTGSLLMSTGVQWGPEQPHMSPHTAQRPPSSA